MDCSGQGYDGAGAVAGKDNALQVKIPRINPKPFYKLWSRPRPFHKLWSSLPVFVSRKRQCVRKSMGEIKEVTYLINFLVAQINNLAEKCNLHAPKVHIKNMNMYALQGE